MASKVKTDGPSVTLAQTGDVQQLAFKDGLTVAQALEAKNWKLTKANEVRLNGAICTDLDTALKPDDQVLVVGQIAGG